jgi:hypothetical protein
MTPARGFEWSFRVLVGSCLAGTACSLGWLAFDGTGFVVALGILGSVVAPLAAAALVLYAHEEVEGSR